MTIFKELKKSFSTQISDKEKVIYLSINITLGILILLSFTRITNLQFVESRLNKAIDIITKLESNKCVKKYIECKRGETKSCEFFKDKVSDKIIFFDIDDNTYKKWNKPISEDELTPRDKLADLINIAVSNGAKVIFSDILLHDRSPDPEEDKKLVDTLKRLRNSDTNIVFPLEFHEQNPAITKTNIDGLHELIEESDNFHWSFPLIMSSPDGVRRYFSGYKIKEDENGKQKVFWGTPVIVTALYNNSYSALKDKEQRILDGTIKDNDLTMDLADNKRVYINSENIFTNRIRFSIVPPAPHNTKNMQGNLSLSRRMTADLLLADSDGSYRKYINGKLVIIGNSGLLKGDNQETPIGIMKGMYVVGNAINTITLGQLQIKPSPGLVFMLAEILVIIFISLLFVFNEVFIHEWLFALILFFIFAMLYSFFDKVEFYKLFFVISVVFVCNNWVYKFMKFLMISGRFKKLSGGRQ